MTLLVRTSFVLSIAVLFCAACVNTPVRRSAFVPRPTVPAHHGAPIGAGGLKGFAQINTLKLTPGAEMSSIEDLLGRLPFEGAAGLWIPRIQAGAGMYGAPSDMISAGAQLTYTRLEWADANVLGVLEFPEEHSGQQMLMGGPGLRINIPVGEEPIITPAVIGEVNIANIPQAVFVREGQTQVTPEGEVITPEYVFERIDRKTMLLPTLALHATVSPIEYLHILVMAGVQRGVKNIGFDPDIQNLENDTLTGYFYGFAGAGLEGRYDLFYATAVVSGAFGQPEEIRFGLSGTFSVGVVFH